MMTAEIESIKIPTLSYYNVSADIWRSLGRVILPSRNAGYFGDNGSIKEIPQEIHDRWNERPDRFLTRKGQIFIGIDCDNRFYRDRLN